MSGNGNEKKKILVAEDNESLRELLELILSDCGFQVVVAVDGAEGLDLFTEKKEEIHLVISDIVMPRMNGIEMTKRIRAIVPNVRAILCSGDFPPEWRKELEDLKVDFLAKPFSPDDLIKKVGILTQVVGL
jgi:hypothetical protein